MKQFEAQLNFRLAPGSHASPDGLGNVCINEAAILAAGFPYRQVQWVGEMPPCFSRPIANYALQLNDGMPDDERQRLMPYVVRLAGTADNDEVELERVRYLAMQAATVFAPRALDGIGLHKYAQLCRDAQDMPEAWAAMEAAMLAAIDARETRCVTRTSPYLEYAATGVVVEVVRAAQAALKDARESIRWWTVGASGLHGWTYHMLQASDRVAFAVVEARAWDDALAALDGVLAIGRQADPIPVELAVERLDRAIHAATA